MSITKYLTKLYDERRELTLLQWTYLAMAAISIIVAGILALFNQSIGVGMLIIPLVAITAMCMNIIAWALVKLAAESFIIKKTNRPSPKKKK